MRGEIIRWFANNGEVIKWKQNQRLNQKLKTWHKY
jgi:hypothetical protein